MPFALVPRTKIQTLLVIVLNFDYRAGPNGVWNCHMTFWQWFWESIIPSSCMHNLCGNKQSAASSRVVVIHDFPRGARLIDYAATERIADCIVEGQVARAV